MSSINVLMNNLEKLKLFKIKENINSYLDMMADGVKTPMDAFSEMIQIIIAILISPKWVI